MGTGLDIWPRASTYGLGWIPFIFWPRNPETLQSSGHLGDKFMWSLLGIHLHNHMNVDNAVCGKLNQMCRDKEYQRSYVSWRRERWKDSCLINFQFLWSFIVLPIFCYCEISLPPFYNLLLTSTGFGGLLFHGWALIKMGPDWMHIYLGEIL